MFDPRDEIDPTRCVPLDSESCLIRPGLPAPPTVCASWAFPGMVPYPGEELFGHYEIEAPLRELLADERWLIVGHNVAYDFACFLEWYPDLRPLIFDAYDANRVLDTMLAQRIVEIETGDKRGRLALDMLCARYGLHVEKHGTDDEDQSIRLGFGKFLGMRGRDIPEPYRGYAIGDPIVTGKLFTRILERKLVKRRDLGKLARADLGLKLTSAEGLMCDPERVAALEVQTVERRGILTDELMREGLVRYDRSKPDPVRNMAAIKQRVAEAFELPFNRNVERAKPTKKYPDGRVTKDETIWTGSPAFLEDLQTQGLITEKGNISTGRLVLEESGDPILAALAEFNEWGAVWNKDLPIFRCAIEVPFHTRFGFAATTRTTSSGPNIQNFRKKAGIRECIFAPEGGALVATDFSGLENATLAQVIAWVLGRKGQADKYSSGFDDHADVGRHMWDGIDSTPYDRFVSWLDESQPTRHENFKKAKEYRNSAKPLNFGLPGYMTRPSTVQSYARIGYGVNKPVEFWAAMIDLWYSTQHDKVAYLKEYVDNLKCGSTYNVPIPATGITRRGATRTAAGNTPFQGLGGQVATEANYRIARDQILGRMPGKVCAFVHDESISRCADDDVDQLRVKQERVMITTAEEIMPDIRMRVESVAMRHWAKKASHIVDDRGRLQIHEV